MPLLDVSAIVEDCILETVPAHWIIGLDAIHDVVMWVTPVVPSKEETTSLMQAKPCCEFNAYGQLFIGLRRVLHEAIINDSTGPLCSSGRCGP